MSGWKQVRLGAYCEVISGYPFKSTRFSDGKEDIPLVKGENVGQGEILWAISKYWPREEADDLARFRLRPGDVVLAMDRPWVPAGLKFARITQADPDALLVQRVARLRATDGLEQSLLPHIIGSLPFVAYVQNVARGVGVPPISGKQISDYMFQLPPQPIQRRIAEILSAYGDLIENNLRRMALLEESARLLYQEWFVRLRFPGHEHTLIIKGVPEGWERKQLGDVIELKYGKALKETDRTEGPFPVYGSSGIIRTHNEALVKGPAIIVGRKGNVGSVYWSEKDCYPIDTVYFIESDQRSFFLFHNLQHQNFMSSDAAVPGLNRKFAYSLPIILPSRTIHSQFEAIVGPICQQVFSLRTMNEKLKQARDLLLPKLMSGEIAV